MISKFPKLFPNNSHKPSSGIKKLSMKCIYRDDALIYAANDVNPDWPKLWVSITCANISRAHFIF